MEQHSTASRQFEVKVRSLNDFNQRIEENAGNKENAGNIPTGKDIINSLKYFQTTLISWVKDANSCFLPSEYRFNTAQFPSADYRDLFDTLVILLRHEESVEEHEGVCEALVSTIACVIPFLSQETILELPTIIAESLYEVSQSLQVKLTDLLVQYVIPLIYKFMTKDVEDDMADINLCIPSLLASVLDATPDIGISTKIMECLMRFKKNVSTDLLTVLAYGTRESLESSIHLLNRYFPPVDIGSVKAYQSPSYESIQPFTCQSDLCKNLPIQKEAVKLCLDPALCALYSNQPPPLYFCQGCYSALKKNNSKLFLDVVQPVSLVSQVCDNMNCRFGFMKALYFCFSLECIKRNEYKPIRLCEDCHSRLHVGPDVSHMNHQCLKELWSTPNPEQTYLVDAIVRLWNEAQPEYHVKCVEMGVEMDSMFLEQSKQQDPISYLKKMFRSFHGLDLLKTTCPLPPSQFRLEHLTRLIAMLLVWVESVEYATHPKAVPIVGQKRKQAISWINKVVEFDINLYASCLLPNPPLAARVGHPWGWLTSVVRKDLEILQRLVTLTKQNLISEQVWDQIMPEWMQEIKFSIPVDEIKKFKKVLGNLFDVKSKIRPQYAINFIEKRLEASLVKQSQEALVWVQILSYLDIKMQIKKLLEMFIEMVIMSNDATGTTEHSVSSAFPFPDQFTLQGAANGNRLSRQNSANVTTPSSDLPVLTNIKDDISISILMMDVLIKQLTLQKEFDGSVIIAPKESTRLSVLLVCVLDQSFNGQHNDHQGAECPHCKVINVVFYQISLLVDLAVSKQVTVNQEKSEYSELIILRTSSNASKNSRMSQTSSVITAATTDTCGTYAESLNSVIMEEEKEEDEKIEEEDEKEEEGFAASEDVTDSIDEVAAERERNIAKLRKQLKQLPSKMDADEILMIHKKRSDLNSSSLFSIPELQILEKLIQQLEQAPETSVMIHILTSLDILCRRGECLKMVAEEDISLLKKIQNQTLIPCLWGLLKSSCSNIAQKVVPMLLYCCCLQFGSERLCSEFEKDFTSEEWEERFAAVDKVGLICQFLSDEYTCKSPYARSSVVYGMVFLTYAIEDMSTMVATRARSIIQSINVTSLKLIYEYMEEHFSNVGDDRLILLHSYRAIHLMIPELSPTSAEFFVMLFKKMKTFEEKKCKLFRDPTVQNNNQNYNGGLLPMYNRRFPSTKSKYSSVNTSPSKMYGRIGYVPLIYYKITYTLQAGKSLRNGQNDKLNDSSHHKHYRMIPSDMSPAVETALDTVSEECENELRQTLSVQPTVTGDTGPTEEEVLSLLIMHLVEFLSSKQKRKINDSLGRTTYDEIQDIISYIGLWMGLERTVTQRWLTPQKMLLKQFRKNPIFVTFLMYLPKLLDGDKNHGQFFLYLALKCMETCIKRSPADDLMQLKLTLIQLEPHLQHAWLTSLIVILYKHSFEDHHEMIWNFINVVKNTIDGHGKHVCGSLKVKESVSMPHLVTMKVNMKKKLKKPLADSTFKGVELQEFHVSSVEKASQNSTLDSKLPRNASELSFSQMQFSDSTEDLILATDHKQCAVCGVALFQYEEETINLAIVALLIFIHMDSTRAAPLIIDVIRTVTSVTLSPTARIAQQFLRCVYQKLAPSRLFPEIFRADNLDNDFFVVMSTVLQDFDMLTQLSPVKLSVQDLNDSKSSDRIAIYLNNLCKYIKLVQHHVEWEALQNIFVTFFGNVIQLMPNQVNMDCLLNIMGMLLTSQRTTFKMLIDLIDNTMSHIIKNCLFSVESLQELCAACVDSFSKERDQTRLTRKVCLIMTTVLSAKVSIGEESVAKLIQFFCIDVGTRYNFEILSHPLSDVTTKKHTKAMEVLDANFANEIIEYLKTPLRRVKESHVNEKLLDSELYQSSIKLAVAQFIAVHISQTDRESRFHLKLLSFLVYNDGHDSLMNQLINLDIQEFVTHFRIYCWVILGTLHHSHMTGKALITLCSPGKALLVAQLIKTVFRGFLEGEENFSKTKTRSHLHFSFLLAQIWTVYIERFIYVQVSQQASDVNPIAMIKEFWSCLTPLLYQLLTHQRQLHMETIQLFSALVENLSVICPRSFTQLYPIWEPLLQLYVIEIPPHIVRKIDASSHGEMFHGESRKDSYRQWLMDIQKQLWTTEHMSKGKQANTSVPV